MHLRYSVFLIEKLAVVYPKLVSNNNEFELCEPWKLDTCALEKLKTFKHEKIKTNIQWGGSPNLVDLYCKLIKIFAWSSNWTIIL